jgi:uncharacterized protein (DUF1778 family)
MPDRSAILLHCSRDQADQIHQRANFHHRPVSNYILSVLMPMVAFEERLYARLTHFEELNRALGRRYVRATGPQTTVLLRCSAEESKRIRSAAARRDMTLSGFVFQSLKRSWVISDQISERHPARATY